MSKEASCAINYSSKVQMKYVCDRRGLLFNVLFERLFKETASRQVFGSYIVGFLSLLLIDSCHFIPKTQVVALVTSPKADFFLGNL